MTSKPLSQEFQLLHLDKKALSQVYCDVRVTPPQFLFYNKPADGVQIKKFTLQNVSSKTAHVIINKPENQNFYILNARENERYVLFPGLVITKSLGYCTQRSEIKTQMKIIINELDYYIPIETKNCAANVIVYPEHLDFGILNIGGSFADRTLTLFNNGSATSKFAIKVGANPMHVDPKFGVLKPSQKKQVRLRAAGVKAGQQSSNIWIECSSSRSKYIGVTITSIAPCIMIHHPVRKGNITVLNFGSTYYGTCAYESFIVRNYSAERTIFILTVENNKHQEVYIESEDDKIKKWLHVWPYHGAMEPFESMVFCVCFRPSKIIPKKGWKHKNLSWDDVLWAKLKVEEVSQQPHKGVEDCMSSRRLGSLRIHKQKRPEESDLSICVHGRAEQGDIVAEPDCISMSTVVGKQDKTTVKLTNPSSRLPIHFEFVKTPFVVTRPVSGVIGPFKSTEILLIFRAKSLGSLNCKLCFNVKSYCNLTDQEEMITLKKKAITLHLYAESVTKQPSAVFNQGITPLVAHEVGAHTDDTKFSSDLRKVPRATIVSMDPEITALFESRDKRDTIAFPNDMSLKLFERPFDDTKRTIFKGTPRYLPPPDPKDALSDFELHLMHERKKGARDFIRGFAEGKIGEEKQLRMKAKSLSEERLHGLLVVPSPSLPLIDPLLKKNQPKKIPKCVVSLTPQQLFNISISPTNFNFGLIPVGVECSLAVTFHNDNPFPITFLFSYDDKLVFPKKILLGPMTQTSQQLTIKLKDTGKYISSFKYIISDMHKFHKTVRAEVVPTFLKFYPSIVDIALPKYPDVFYSCHTTVTLVNPFSSPTKFHWQADHRHIVELIPESGVIKDNDSITCLCYIHKFFKTKKKLIVKLSAGGTVVNSLTVFIPAYNDYKVVPISPVLNLKTIAAGIKITKPLYLFNYGCYKTAYFVRNTFPIEGIEIHPKCGIIAAKSLETVEVTLKLECLMILNIDIIIDIEGTTPKKIQLVGNVSFPTVEYQPNILNFISTKSYSFSTQAVTAINKGNEDVILTFKLQKYVQFKVTTTPQHYDPEIRGGITLKGNSSQTIYVHFKPEHIAAYEFYLPICINGFLGPPDSKKGTNNPSNYMGTPVEKPPVKKKSIRNISLSSHFNTILKPPDFFDAVWITCVVRPPDIVFSSLREDFACDMPEETCTKKIFISNPKSEPVTIQIGRIDIPFKLTSVKDENSPLVIAGNDKFEMIVTFSPYKTGSWSVLIPVSVVKGGTTFHYNDLVFTAICHPSSLYCSTPEIYLIPVPLGTRIDKKIIIFASHQREDADLRVLTICKTNVDRKVGVEFPESPHIPKNTEGFYVPITISFLSADVISFEVKLIFRDGMEGELEITVYAAATDSLIPNHWFYFNTQNHDEEGHDACSRLMRSESTESRGSCPPKRLVDTVGWRDSEIIEVVSFAKQRLSSATMLYFPCGIKSELSAGNFSVEDQLFYWSKIYSYVTRWLLSSVFCGSYQPKLEDITWSKDFMEQSQLKPSVATTKTFIDLIMTLFGPEIMAKTNLSSDCPAMDDYSRINYCLRAYTKILGQMEVYGVGLSHINPFYLLNYNDYCTLYDWNVEKIPGTPLLALPSAKKNKKDFDSFSKKMWLEFYLQLFKSHTLDMCVGLAVVDDWPNVRRGTIQSTLTLSEYHSIAFDKMSPISKIITGDMLDQVNQDRSHSEAVLMAWISRTYNKVKNEGTIDLPSLEDDKIMDLGPSLRNGVVLAGVTAYYCPFLVHILSNIKQDPTTNEEVCHNVNILVLSWGEVKLGLITSAEDMLECNPVFMMMLIAYLYLSLPTFLPSYILRASVPLADAGITVLSVTNQSNYELRYFAKLYQDPHEPFSIVGDKKVYIIKPRATVNVVIHFVSNRIGKVSGLLLLCGANGPPITGVNICVKLEGEPTLIKISNKITIKLPMYQRVFFYQRICSPYDKVADYNINISITKPSLDNQQIQESSARSKCVFPPMLVAGCKSLEVPGSTSFGTIQLACCCFFASQVVRWITFSSPTAGEFVCKVIIQPQDEFNPRSFTIEFPMSGPENALKEEAFIPIDLKMTCSNTSLVRSSVEMLSLVVKYDELYFYRKYWGRYIGVKLFEQEILTHCPGLLHTLKLFCQSTVTYDITCDSPYVDVQKKLTIPDVTSEESVILPIRLKASASKPFCTKLRLKHSNEQRVYRLTFVPVWKNDKK